jgi:hypothetical protein
VVVAGIKRLAVLALLWSAGPLLAQDSGPGQAPANFFSLPVELERDFGASNGNATFLRFLPLYSFRLNDGLRLVNLDLVIVADAPGGVPGRPGNPEPQPGPQELGLSDVVHASFVTPDTEGNFIWGAGLIFGIPTATDETLGSGKWSAGPAFRVRYLTGPWSIGAVAGQRWSFAGDADRADINQLMIRGAIRRQLPRDWFFTSAPIITANWNAGSGQRWLVPLGGGIGRAFRVSRIPWAVSAQAYYRQISGRASVSAFERGRDLPADCQSDRIDIRRKLRSRLIIPVVTP